jgi:hypothetical protein
LVEEKGNDEITSSIPDLKNVYKKLKSKVIMIAG